MEFDEKTFEMLVERMVVRDDEIEVVWDDWGYKLD